jgi:hypothetical protein
MVFMILTLVLMAMHRTRMIVVNAVVAGVSSEVVAMTVMSIVNARLLDANRVRLEMHMVTRSSLNGTVPSRETILGCSVARCL